MGPDEIAGLEGALSVPELYKWSLMSAEFERAFDAARALAAYIVVAEIPRIADGSGPAGDKKQRWEAQLKVASFWNPR